MHTIDLFDVTIIGGGPTGMFAAFYAGMRELKTKIIETMPVLGGQVEIIYPEKNIFDIGAFPYVKGTDLIDQLEIQMQPFDPTICLEETVLSIIKKDGIFKIETTEGMHYSKTVLVTTGQGSFEARKLTFEYNEDYEETNLQYYVRKLESYRGKEVVICGGGDSAVDLALTLEPIAKKVTIVHRRNKFRAHEASVTKMKNSAVEIVTPFIPKELIGDDNVAHNMRFIETRGDKEQTIAADYFIVSFGFVSDNRQLMKWGLDTEHSSVKVNQKMATNIPGIFGAGDVTTFDGKVKLIATGFGEAPTAINSIIQYLNPEKFIQAPLSADADMAVKFSSHFEENSN